MQIMAMPVRDRRILKWAWAGCLALTVSVPAFAGDDADAAAGETTFNGTLFFDVSHLNQYKNHRPQDVSRNGADLKRFYLSLGHRFSKVWSLHVTTDVNWLRDESPTDVWFKRAYVEADFSPAFEMRLGSADTPWVSFVNRWSGYRYVDKDLIMRLKFGNSADWGVHTLGSFGASGQVQYAVSLLSGAGYKRPRVGDSADLESRLAWQPSTHTVLAVGGYRGKRAQDASAPPVFHTAQRWDAMAAYADSRFRLGAQYLRANDWNQVRDPLSDRASGWSAWASMQVAPDWSVFVRRDRTRLSQRLNPDKIDRYVNGGVEWKASRSLRLAAVYKRESVHDDGSALTESNEIGVWGQLKF